MENKPLLREYVLTNPIKKLFRTLNDKNRRFYKVILPVTKKCFSQCIFCGTQDLACNLAKKDISSIISPKEAIDIARKIRFKNVILEIGGFGDPLFNEETFQTLRLLIIEDIEIPTFITTNGLLIHDKIDDILSVSIKTVKIIINSLDPNIGKRLIKGINFRGTSLIGLDSAFLFQELQLQGIQRLLKKDVNVVVQTIIFPGTNDRHIPEIIDVLNMLGVKYLDLRISSLDEKSIKIYKRLKAEVKDKISLVHF